MSQIQVIENEVLALAPKFNDVLSGKSLNFAAEAEFAIQTLMRNEYTLKIASSNRQSVLDAVVNIAAIGISLNPAKRQAYLVPRDGRICLDISYMGLMDLAMQAGSIRWAQCALVHESDEFSLNGLDKQPLHKFNPFSKDRGDVVGVYAVVKTSDGDFLTHAMSIDDVNAIRDKSSAWKAFVEKKRSCPWVTNPGEMIKKTCIKQACKYWPRGTNSDRLENAIHYLNDKAGEGMAIDPPQSGGIKPTDGAMETLPTDQQEYLRELAADLGTIFALDGGAAVLDRVTAENFDSQQTVALWTLLPSDMRREIKAEKAARTEAEKVLS